MATIAYVLVYAVMNYFTQQATMSITMQQQGPTPVPMGQGFVTAMALMTSCMTVVMGGALPVFFLIWFRREAIRSEVAEWRA